MQMEEGSFNGGSEQVSTSDDAQIVSGKQVNGDKMMEKEIELIVIRIIQRVIGPTMENLVRKVVKDEILSAQEKFLSTGGNRNSHTDETIVSREKILELKFLDDEVSGPVLTGREIKGKGGNPMMVALVDEITGDVVKCGPESSAKVEILVLDSSGRDEHNPSFEDFNDMIIKEGEKKKPHFTKARYIYLKEGCGVLVNSKLGHEKDWMKNCECRLGARVVGNFDGIKVRKTWTKPFTVLDSRSKLYEKSYPPSLSDEIWRLEQIGKDGAPCKNLNEMNIWTVKDFRFLHSADPKRLQKIAAGAKGKASVAKWKATVDHAQTCIIDDNKIYLYCPPSSGCKMGVTFDVVGGLKGLIRDSHFVPINNLSEDEKVRAREMLWSAYDNQKDISSFVDEASLLHKFPYESSDVNGCDLATSQTINGYDSMGPGTSSQSIIPSVKAFARLDSFGLLNVGPQPFYEPHLPYHESNCWIFDFDHILQYCGDNDNLTALTFPDNTLNVPKTLEAETRSRQQSNDSSTHSKEFMDAIICMVRAGQRFMALRNIRVRKRRRIC